MYISHKLHIFVLYYEEKLFCDFVYLPMQYSNLKEICFFFALTGLFNPEKVLIMIYILCRYIYI